MNARYVRIGAVTAAALMLAAGVARGEPAATATPPATDASRPEPADDGVDPAVARDVSQFNLDKNGLAIQGYDPVSYFDPSTGPLKGDAKLAYRYRGVTYRFASAANLEAFKLNPRKYEPSHGGWCSTAMADGKKVEINPKASIVAGGRLFLFYKTVFQDARSDWNTDVAKNTQKADQNWQKLSGVAPPAPDAAKSAPEPKAGEPK